MVLTRIDKTQEIVDSLDIINANATVLEQNDDTINSSIEHSNTLIANEATRAKAAEALKATNKDLEEEQERAVDAEKVLQQAITDKSKEQDAKIALNASKRHSHSNKDVIDKLGETADGKLTFNGKVIE